MPRIYTGCTSAMVCIVVAGCSRVGTTSSGSKVKVGRASAVAYGHRVNLRASDVPKLVAAKFPRSQETMTGPFGAYLEKCYGVVINPEMMDQVTSHRFQSVDIGVTGGLNLVPRESVQSAVSVMSGASLAHREVAAAVSPHGLTCLKRFALRNDPAVKPEGGEANVPLFNKISTSHIQWRVDGVLINGLRTVSHVTIEGGVSGAPNYYQDQWAIANGPAVTTLLIVGSPRQVPAAEERRLLTLLYRRAKSAQSPSVM